MHRFISLCNGPQGCVAKDMEVADLIAAIRSVRRSRKFVTPSIAESLLVNVHSLASDPTLYTRLSACESQILGMVVVGDSLTAIAERLSINIKAVSTYCRRLLEKQGLGFNALLVQYAVNNRLVD